MRPINILITGPGCSGKSSLRRQLVEFLNRYEVPFVQYDADNFGELRDERDRVNAITAEQAQQELSQRQRVVLIEDVRGTQLEREFRAISAYDLIIYLVPSRWSYFRFWLSRAKIWFSRGHYAWTRDDGWQGTGRPYDWRNLWNIFLVILAACWIRKRWLKQDRWILKNARVTTLILETRWTPNGPQYIFKF